MTREQVEAVLDSMEANARRGIPPWVHDAPTAIGDLVVAYHDATETYVIGTGRLEGKSAVATGVKRHDFWTTANLLQAAVMETA